MEKIQDGRFKFKPYGGEPIYIETCLFLLECLQIHELDRIAVDSLLSSPYICDDFMGIELHKLDQAKFWRDLQA